MPPGPRLPTARVSPHRLGRGEQPPPFALVTRVLAPVTHLSLTDATNKVPPAKPPRCHFIHHGESSGIFCLSSPSRSSPCLHPAASSPNPGQISSQYLGNYRKRKLNHFRVVFLLPTPLTCSPAFPPLPGSPMEVALPPFLINFPCHPPGSPEVLPREGLPCPAHLEGGVGGVCASQRRGGPGGPPWSGLPAVSESRWGHPCSSSREEGWL